MGLVDQVRAPSVLVHRTCLSIFAATHESVNLAVVAFGSRLWLLS
jgi:hypothetical protein